MLLGELLRKENIITDDQLNAALAESKNTGEFLGRVLIDAGYIDEEQFYPVLAEHLGVPYIRISDQEIESDAIALLTPEIAFRFEILPVKIEGGTLFIATADPCNIEMIDELRMLVRHEIRPLVAKRSEVSGALKTYFGLGSETIHRIVKKRGADDVSKLRATADTNDIVDDASIVKLVNQILTDGYNNRSTDIHLEPYEDEFRIRYRIDGVLYPVSMSRHIKQFQEAIVSRIKVMSSLNIAEKRLPQDGRFKMRMSNEEINIRVSILPTPYGEGVQIRLLSTSIFQLNELGMKPDDLKIIENTLKKPHGIMFVTGPTGSGKTTSLYACLQKLNNDERKIITIEDPIEYQLKGITQIQIHPGIGLTFAQGLRSMLRHDPDVMMVGEVRDNETAEIAIRVALTGHLVLSTLHTNDAPGAVTRLLDMGIEPYLISSSVECIVAQRLVRVICPHCKTREKAPAGLLEKMGCSNKNITEVYRGTGCEECKNTGYKGRTGIHEILVLDDTIRELVLKMTPANEIRKAAIGRGMRTLRDHGLEKIADGTTTISEVLKVTHENE